MHEAHADLKRANSAYPRPTPKTLRLSVERTHRQRSQLCARPRQPSLLEHQMHKLGKNQHSKVPCSPELLLLPSQIQTQIYPVCTIQTAQYVNGMVVGYLFPTCRCSLSTCTQVSGPRDTVVSSQTLPCSIRTHWLEQTLLFLRVDYMSTQKHSTSYSVSAHLPYPCSYRGKALYLSTPRSVNHS